MTVSSGWHRRPALERFRFEPLRFPTSVGSILLLRAASDGCDLRRDLVSRLARWLTNVLVFCFGALPGFGALGFGAEVADLHRGGRLRICGSFSATVRCYRCVCMCVCV